MSDRTKSTQKFCINPDGTVFVEWVNPDFSDVIIDALYSEEDKKQIVGPNKFINQPPKIYCG